MITGVAFVPMLVARIPWPVVAAFETIAFIRLKGHDLLIYGKE